MQQLMETEFYEAMSPMWLKVLLRRWRISIWY